MTYANYISTVPPIESSQSLFMTTYRRGNEVTHV